MSTMTPSQRQRVSTPQNVEVNPQTQVKCTNCGTIYEVDTLDPEMRCPKCNHTGWVPANEDDNKPKS